MLGFFYDLKSSLIRIYSHQCLAAISNHEELTSLMSSVIIYETWLVFILFFFNTWRSRFDVRKTSKCP